MHHLKAQQIKTLWLYGNTLTGKVTGKDKHFYKVYNLFKNVFFWRFYYIKSHILHPIIFLVNQKAFVELELHYVEKKTYFGAGY